MNSIRKRFLYAMIGGSSVLLILFAIILFFAMDHALNRAANRNLLMLAQSIATQITVDHGKVRLNEVNFEGTLPGPPPPPDAPKFQVYLQVWDSQGNTVYRSRSLRRFTLPYETYRHYFVCFQETFLPGSPSLSTVWISFHPLGNPSNTASLERISVQISEPGVTGTITLAVAIPQIEVDRSLWQLFWFLTFFTAILIAFLALMIYWFVEWSMKPITLVGNEIEKISYQNLTQRFREEDIYIELKPFIGKINSMLDRLEYSLKKEQQFTSDVSHELRTPLSAIRCGLDVMLHSSFNSSPQKSTLNEILKSVEQMQRMSEDLLTLSKADSGHYETVTDSLDMGEIITESVAQIAPLSHAKGISIEWDPPMDEFPIRGDYDRLCRLCINLLSNAIHYNKPKGVVKITIESIKEAISFSIRDTGIGIPSDKLNLIFNRFYRVDSSRNYSRGGAGLGLSIVKWIVDTHQGKISIQSQLNEGTTITVVFPRSHDLK